MPIFEIYDSQQPRRIRIDGPRLTIGRTMDNHIIVDDRIASRVHCEIRHSHGHYVLRDLQSRNGTRVNQDPLARPVVLQNGDEISVGHATVRFWSDVQSINPSAPEMPLIDKLKKKRESKARVSSRAVYHQTGNIPTGKQPRQPVPAAPTKAPAPAMPVAQTKPTSSADSTALGQVVKLETSNNISLPALGPSGELTLNHILPLNAEGKAAHPTDQDASEISVAMLRLKQLLLRAFQLRATDIHIEPKEEQIQLRYRIDGYLHHYGSLDRTVTQSVYSIIKLLCNLDISKKHIMQDGSFAVQLPNRRVDMRISLAPTTMGDKMVLRLLDKSLAPQGLDSLGMEPVIFDQVRRLAHQESSMMVVCGPTGSGKTTTVYAILQDMNHADRNIVTVEDPVEYKLDNISQIQVNPRFNVTFASALMSLLRQDPDVILIGEMRDADTAQMAVQSAMTGHLVLSTLHARDSIGSIFRLLDLGVEPFLLGSALTAVLSQRLLRRLCDDCKMKVQPSTRRLADLHLEELVRHTLYNRVGCRNCMEIGYRGRIPIFEMLNVNDQIREAIAERPTIQQLRVAAGDWIFQTLREDAIRKIRNGLTSLEEFTSVIGSREG